MPLTLRHRSRFYRISRCCRILSPINSRLDTSIWSIQVGLACRTPNCSITPLLQAFETARHAAPDLRLHLVGALSLEEQSEVAASSQSVAIELHGVVSPSQAVAMQKDSDGLVLVAAPDATVVPSKIVEYQAAQRPILLVGSPRLRASTPGQELSVTDQMLALAKSQLAVLVDDMPATHLEAGQWAFDQLRGFRDKACPAKPLSETDGNGS